MGVCCELTPRKQQPHEFSTSLLLSELLLGMRHCHTLQNVKQVIGERAANCGGKVDKHYLSLLSPLRKMTQI